MRGGSKAALCCLDVILDHVDKGVGIMTCGHYRFPPGMAIKKNSQVDNTEGAMPAAEFVWRDVDMRLWVSFVVIIHRAISSKS